MNGEMDVIHCITTVVEIVVTPETGEAEHQEMCMIHAVVPTTVAGQILARMTVVVTVIS